MEERDESINTGIKLLSLFIYATGVALIRKILPVLLILPVSLSMMVISKGYKKWKNILSGNFFLIFIWFVIPFTYPGHQIFKLWKIAITYEGVKTSLLITLKLNAILMASISIFSTTTIYGMMAGLKWLKIPDMLILLFFLIYRYWFFFLENVDRLKKTVKARGFTPSLNLHTYRVYGNIIGSLIIKGFTKGEKVSMAMRCRGFDGRFKPFVEVKTRKREYAMVIASILVLIIIFIVEWKI